MDDTINKWTVDIKPLLSYVLRGEDICDVGIFAIFKITLIQMYLIMLATRCQLTLLNLTKTATYEGTSPESRKTFTVRYWFFLPIKPFPPSRPQNSESDAKEHWLDRPNPDYPHTQRPLGHIYEGIGKFYVVCSLVYWYHVDVRKALGKTAAAALPASSVVASMLLGTLPRLTPLHAYTTYPVTCGLTWIVWININIKFLHVYATYVPDHLFTMLGIAGLEETLVSMVILSAFIHLVILPILRFSKTWETWFLCIVRHRLIETASRYEANGRTIAAVHRS